MEEIGGEQIQESSEKMERIFGEVEGFGEQRDEVRRVMYRLHSHLWKHTF